MELLRPWVLLLLPALAGLGWWYWRAPAGLGDWVRVADPALLRAMKALGHASDGGAGRRLWLMLGAAFGVLVALAGPAEDREEAVVYRNLDGVIFVLEASEEAVTGEDWPAMLAVLRNSVENLGTRPAALIVYAGDAYVALDMTYDTGELGLTAALIEPGTVPDPGAAPERALALAARLMQQGALQSGDVVLIAAAPPGEAALAAGATLAALPVRVSTVLPGVSDAAALRAVAGGRGQGFGLTDGAALQNFLAESPYAELAEAPLPLHHNADLGRWFLLLALLPLSALFWGREA